jgi:hypothetical protein
MLEIHTVTFSDKELVVSLYSRGCVYAPLTDFPRLANASKENLQDFFISFTGIHWEKLNEDLSINGLARDYGIGYFEGGNFTRIHAGEILLDGLYVREVSVEDFAKTIGESYCDIRAIIDGEQDIDKKMADKLAEYFKTTSSEFWLKI